MGHGKNCKERADVKTVWVIMTIENLFWKRLHMSTIDGIIELIKELSSEDKIEPTTDIFKDAGLVGDDFDEMIEKFALKYSVDMTGYIWYFHTDEEGLSIGSFFFAPPNEQVERIPVTPATLAEFVEKGRWDIHYPDHKIPTKRYDLLMNKIIMGIFLIIIILTLISKCI